MSSGAGQFSGGWRAGDARGGGRAASDGQGAGRGGRGGSNDGLPIIKGQKSRYCPYCKTVVWDYYSRVKCPTLTCKRILPHNPPTLPSGFMWCGDCKTVSVSALHVCCLMCGWLTPLGEKRQEDTERYHRIVVAQQQKLNAEIDALFKGADVEVERARQEELEMEIEADKAASQLEQSAKAGGEESANN